MEKDFCNKCGECCRNIAVDFGKRIVYRDGIQTLSTELEECLIKNSTRENITFCSCRYLVNNLCTNPKKPYECIVYPSSPFAFLPDECAYQGKIFLEQEKVKQKVRKLKEEIIDYETQLASDKSLQRIIDRHNAFINKYKAYGSEDW